LGDKSPNLPHNIYFFELVITYPLFTLTYKRWLCHVPGTAWLKENVMR
jgi:hypothetical protein